MCSWTMALESSVHVSWDFFAKNKLIQIQYECYYFVHEY